MQEHLAGYSNPSSKNVFQYLRHLEVKPKILEDSFELAQMKYTGTRVGLHVTKESLYYDEGIQHTEFPLIDCSKTPITIHNLSSPLVYITLQSDRVFQICLRSREVRNPTGLIGILDKSLFSTLESPSTFLNLGAMMPDRWQKVFGGCRNVCSASPITEILTRTPISPNAQYGDKITLWTREGLAVAGLNSTETYAHFCSSNYPE